MISTPRHIEEELRRVYPDVRLRYNHNLRSWVISAEHFFPNRLPAWQLFVKPGAGLRGTTEGKMVRERVLYVLRDDLGAFEPHLDLILATLHRSFTGADHEAVDRETARFEGAEDREKDRARRNLKDMQKDVARAAIYRKRGRVISTRDGFMDRRKKDREFASRIRAEQAEEREAAQVAARQEMARVVQAMES